jgi:hypothetical protein
MVASTPSYSSDADARDGSHRIFYFSLHGIVSMGVSPTFSSVAIVGAALYVRLSSLQPVYSLASMSPVYCEFRVCQFRVNVVVWGDPRSVRPLGPRSRVHKACRSGAGCAVRGCRWLGS